MEQATIEINDRTSDRDESKPSASNGDGSRLEFVFRYGDEEFVPARTFRAIAGISHSTLLRYARKGLVRTIPVGSQKWYGLGAIKRQCDLLTSDIKGVE